MDDARAPERMSFTNLATGETWEAPLNPTELDEALKANWEELAVLGLSHKVQQYTGTDPHGFAFTIRCDAYAGGQNRLVENLAFRRFLISLFYSRRGSQDVIGGAPPRFLFIWPSFITLTCNIHSANIKHRLFTDAGQPRLFDAEISIKEIRDVRLYSEDVISEGTLRSNQ